MCSKNPVNFNLYENLIQKIDKRIIFDFILDRFDYKLEETVSMAYIIFNTNYFDITIRFANQQQFKYKILKDSSNVFSCP